jgi:hypothetical protein
MPKLKAGKETVKFLAILNHAVLCALSPPFSLPARDLSELPPLRSCRFNDLTIQRFNAVFASQTESRLVKASPTKSNHPSPATPTERLFWPVLVWTLIDLASRLGHALNKASAAREFV